MGYGSHQGKSADTHYNAEELDSSGGTRQGTALTQYDTEQFVQRINSLEGRVNTGNIRSRLIQNKNEPIVLRAVNIGSALNSVVLR